MNGPRHTPRAPLSLLLLTLLGASLSVPRNPLRLGDALTALAAG